MEFYHQIWYRLYSDMVIFQGLYTLGKPGKSWSFRISFSRPGKSWNNMVKITQNERWFPRKWSKLGHGKLGEVMEKSWDFKISKDYEPGILIFLFLVSDFLNNLFYCCISGPYRYGAADHWGSIYIRCCRIHHCCTVTEEKAEELGEECWGLQLFSL